MNWFKQAQEGPSYIQIGHKSGELAEVWWLQDGRIYIKDADEGDHYQIGEMADYAPAKGRIDYERKEVSVVTNSYPHGDFLQKIKAAIIRTKPETANFKFWHSKALHSALIH